MPANSSIETDGVAEIDLLGETLLAALAPRERSAARRERREAVRAAPAEDTFTCGCGCALRDGDIGAGVLVRRMFPRKTLDTVDWAVAEYLYVCPRCGAPHRVAEGLHPDGNGNALPSSRNLAPNLAPDSRRESFFPNAIDMHLGASGQIRFLLRRAMGIAPPQHDRRLMEATETGWYFGIDLAPLVAAFHGA